MHDEEQLTPNQRNKLDDLAGRLNDLPEHRHNAFHDHMHDAKKNTNDATPSTRNFMA